MTRSHFAIFTAFMLAPIAFFGFIAQSATLAFKIAFDPEVVAAPFTGLVRRVTDLVLSPALARVRSFRERQLVRELAFSPGLVLSPV